MGIKIKAKGEGVFEIAVQLGSTYAEMREAIRHKLERSRVFFTGAGAKAIITGHTFSETQKKDLRRMMQTDYDIMELDFSCDRDETRGVDDVEIKKSVVNEAEADGNVHLVSKKYFKAKSIFVSHTLRSGQRVECEGDVVVLGDVNDGAEVIAGGSIAVMGRVRGLVHAGATGRSDVVIAANSLRPKQLRISGKIAIFPDGKEPQAPEIAEYRQGSIIIKPLRPQSNKK